MKIKKGTPYNFKRDLNKNNNHSLDYTLKKLNKEYQKIKKMPGRTKRDRRKKNAKLNVQKTKWNQLKRLWYNSTVKLNNNNLSGAGQSLYEIIGELNFDAALAGEYGESIRSIILKFAKHYDLGDVDALKSEYLEVLNDRSEGDE